MQRRTLLTPAATSAVILAMAGGAAAWLQAGMQNGKLSLAGREFTLA